MNTSKTEEEKARKIVIDAMAHFECSMGESYIFRGESRNYNSAKNKTKALSSGLYKEFLLNNQKLSGNEVDLIAEEKEIVARSKQHFPSGVKNIDVLTEIQHFRGKTALIDFTNNILVALFFACNGNIDNTGHLYGFNRGKFTPKNEIEYTIDESQEDIIINPTGKIPRVIFQSSIFVHAHKGFMEKEKCFYIPNDKKIQVLNFLKDKFGIEEKTVYNDIYGQIETEMTRFKSEIEYKNGISFLGNTVDGKDKQTKKLKQAVGCFKRALESNPMMKKAYLERAKARVELGRDKLALEDCRHILILEPNHNEAKQLYRDLQEKIENE